VAWLYREKQLTGVLVPIATNADIIQMINATKYERTPMLFLDHTNFLRTLRADLISTNVELRLAATCGVQASGSSTSSSLVVAEDNGQDFVSHKIHSDTESESDFEF
jgi:hypothetical protein